MVKTILSTYIVKCYGLNNYTQQVNYSVFLTSDWGNICFEKKEFLIQHSVLHSMSSASIAKVSNKLMCFFTVFLESNR